MQTDPSSEKHTKGIDDFIDFSRVRRLTWGIFEIAFEIPPAPNLLTCLSSENLQKCSIDASFLLMFLTEIYQVAPKSMIIHVMNILWLSISPAVSLHLVFMAITCIHEMIVTKSSSGADEAALQQFICMWLVSGVVNVCVERNQEENYLVLGSYLKCHFLPLLAKSSLCLDMKCRHDHESFPKTWGFGEGAPGLDFLKELSVKIQHIITFSLVLGVLTHIIFQSNRQDFTILSALTLYLIIVMLSAPKNAVGGAGFVYWTKNEHYHRLSALYYLIFGDEFRWTLAKDGLNNFLFKEFKRESDSLGIVKSDIFALNFELPVPWYWDLAKSVHDYPMALYAMMLPWSFSSSSLARVAIFQFAAISLKRSIWVLRRGYGSVSLRDIAVKAKDLYATLHIDNKIFEGTRNYPDKEASSPRGMGISFRNVTISHGSGEFKFKALQDISIDIRPGSLVLIVGVNGSGKSSLLNLIPRLLEPSSGEIYVDDRPLTDYDVLQLRKSTAYLTQSEEIFPVSIKENMLMGLNDEGQSSIDTYVKLDEAARLGGSFDLIQRLGYDKVLYPLCTAWRSPQGVGFGVIGEAAEAELNRNFPPPRCHPISIGEKQRLIASRTFMRVKNTDIRLLLVDEPTSAMDPIAEHEMFSQFLKVRDGKTTIFVTHHFGHIVQHADLIICMDSGRIIEQGNHKSLMENSGLYSRLYDSQAEGLLPLMVQE